VLIQGNYIHHQKKLAKIVHQELVIKCRLSRRKRTPYHKYGRFRWHCDLRLSLWPVEFLDREFEPRSGHGCSSFMFVLCRLGRATVRTWSLCQRIPTEWMSNCVLSRNLETMRPRPEMCCCPIGKNNYKYEPKYVLEISWSMCDFRNNWSKLS